MFGWGENNVAWGCPIGHLDLMHTKGMQIPKTYDGLKDLMPVATDTSEGL
jgi:hypothetical protein